MTLNRLLWKARDARVGYAVESGFERLEKIASNTWKFTGEDGVESIHSDREAAELLEDYFPGSLDQAPA